MQIVCFGYGVPRGMARPDVRNATEDTVLDLAAHLPSEAAPKRCSILAIGVDARQVAQPISSRRLGADPFAHPDARGAASA